MAVRGENLLKFKTFNASPYIHGLNAILAVKIEEKSVITKKFKKHFNDITDF